MLLTRRPAIRFPIGPERGPDLGDSPAPGRAPAPSATSAADAEPPAADPAATRAIHSLRLVRMRLGLTLLAAAIVPIALAAPFMVRMGQEIQAVAPAEASAASARLTAQLDGIRGASSLPAPPTRSRQRWPTRNRPGEGARRSRPRREPRPT
jgi:hypothetical protein